MSFLRSSVLALLLVLCVSPVLQASEAKEPRGERVGWARLKTTSPYWYRHARADPELMLFIRENTSLNIDSLWHVAEVGKLDEMSRYPLIFSQGIDMVDDAAGRRNLAEYIRRGGFLLIDACINHAVTPNPDAFLVDQKRVLTQILPESRVAPLPSDHPLYQSYFQIPRGKPPHTYHDNIFDGIWDKHGLYGLFIGNRLAGVVSLSGLQCGWDHMPAPAGHNVACMQMLVNIYIYAILQND